MPPKALRPCKQVGCRNLVQSGYCDQHQSKAVSNVQSLRALDDRKEQWQIDFYSSYKWRCTSESFRKEHPLCMDCLEKEPYQISKTAVAHHEPPLVELVKLGLDPHDKKYLRSACTPCHQRHLNEKKWRKD